MSVNTGTDVVQISDAEAKLLQEKSLRLELLSQLMDCEIIIGTDQIDSGIIVVKYGDPEKVKEIIGDIVCLVILACGEDDEEVLKDLGLLSQKFPTQLEKLYDKSSSAFNVAFSKAIEADVRPVLDSLKTTKWQMPLPSYKANFVHNRLKVIQTSIQSSLNSSVKVQLTTDSSHQPVLEVSGERAGFAKAKEMVNKVIMDIQQKEENLDSVLAMFLQGVRGQAEVKSLEKKHNSQITVISPWLRVLWKARSQRGHRVIVCESNMAATDCDTTILPLCDGQEAWSPLQKNILNRSFLTSDLSAYASEVGSYPKPSSMTLQCIQGAALQRMDLSVSRPQSVEIMSVAKATDTEFTKRVSEGCKEIFTKLKAAGPTNRSIAIPVRLNPDVVNVSGLDALLPTVEEQLEQQEGVCTVMLCLEPLTAAEREELTHVLQQSLSKRWCTETSMYSVDAQSKDEQQTHTASEPPAVLVCGHEKDVTATLTQIKELQIPEDFRDHSLRLINFLEDKPPRYNSLGVIEKREHEHKYELIAGEEQSAEPSQHLALSASIADLPSVTHLETTKTVKKSETVPQLKFKSLSSQKSPSSGTVRMFVTMSGLKVLVYKSDVTKLNVDAIVNAANERLRHDGGVALAIAKAAGDELKKESREYINKHGPLSVKDVAVTTGGLLPCSEVLHAVGPRWDDYEDKDQCQQDLIYTVFNCLQKAASLGFSSVAVSSISSAIFGVPQQTCAECYLSAVQKFQDQPGHGNFTDIHFVDISDVMIDIIQSTFEVNWKGASFSKMAAAEKKVSVLPLKSSQSEAETSSAENTDKFVMTTKTGIKVSVYKSDITKVQVDAIVSATNESLCHNHGVANAIATAAGSDLKKEVENRVKKNGPVKVSEVVATTAGSLPCKKVLHAVGPRWSDYKNKTQCQQHLVSTVFNCLQTAASLKCASVALPSISSAIFGVPQQICAESYMSAVQKFADGLGDSTTSITQIDFVDISEEKVQIIKDVFAKGCDTKLHVSPAKHRYASMTFLRRNKKKST